jgi:hypothetical protein
MCIEQKQSENFRQKVVELANKLQADVMNESDILIEYDCLANLQNIVLSPTKAQPNQSILVGLERQDVFLVEKIAYYSKNTTNGNLFMDGESSSGLMSFYNGVLSFTQKKTKVATNIHLYNFVKRNRVGSSASQSDYEFDATKLWQEVVPYWLLSGERDNTFEIQLSQNTAAVANSRMILHLKGVLFPNVSSKIS